MHLPQWLKYFPGYGLPRRFINSFALLTHLMTVVFIAQCTPFPSMVHLLSIEGIAWQDCLDLCIACASDYSCPGQEINFSAC